MAVAVWDPLRSARCCSCAVSLPHTTTSTSTSTSSTGSRCRSNSSSVGASSAATRLRLQNGGDKALVGGGQVLYRRISISLALLEAMHVEPRVHCTARGGSGILQVARVHLPDSMNVDDLNRDGEGRRLQKGTGSSRSRLAAGRLFDHSGKKHGRVTRVTSSANDSPPPGSSAAAAASDDVDMGVTSAPLSSPPPPISSATSEGVVSVEGEAVEGGVSAVGGVLSREAEREAESFAVVNTGDYECRSCGYEYIEVMGDASYPIPPGMPFTSLPSDWACPICGAPRTYFNPKRVEIAGFVQNQKYGLGGNSMTSGQKSLLIYGSLLFFFAVFLSGYFLQ
ncbi:hypothetical protein CBR_g55374 [Chara braunii]|uniref:Rubredoxin-like domain-containing protein n=1 Tax=Chara braunii TaxID=69332 RepID=A0A388MCZ6_CHABU|nr:hypothetical protein CBR_g55374 [Chara braunii]|eukprot:GBG92437.1 hypothetical protein CBR_g55374 [Chara braunii]